MSISLLHPSFAFMLYSIGEKIMKDFISILLYERNPEK